MDTVNIKVNGLNLQCKQFIGIGTLNVMTTRGEVKTISGDFICTFVDTGVTIVLPESTVQALVEGDSADQELSEKEKEEFFKDLGDGSAGEKLNEATGTSVPASTTSSEAVPPASPATIVDPLKSMGL